MTLPLSDMSREALVRELRIAQSRRDEARVKACKVALAKKTAQPTRIGPVYDAAPTSRPWWQRED
jgi:hypothetical protein